MPNLQTTKIVIVKCLRKVPNFSYLAVKMPVGNLSVTLLPEGWPGNKTMWCVVVWLAVWSL